MLDGRAVPNEAIDGVTERRHHEPADARQGRPSRAVRPPRTASDTHVHCHILTLSSQIGLTLQLWLSYPGRSRLQRASGTGL
jgi:hypothetical protein